MNYFYIISNITVGICSLICFLKGLMYWKKDIEKSSLYTMLSLALLRTIHK